MSSKILSGRLFINSYNNKPLKVFKDINLITYKFHDIQYYIYFIDDSLDFLPDDCIYVSFLNDMKYIYFLRDNIYTKVKRYNNSNLVFLYEKRNNEPFNQNSRILGIFNDQLYLEMLTSIKEAGKPSQILRSLSSYIGNKKILCNTHVFYNVLDCHNHLTYSAEYLEEHLTEYQNKTKTIAEVNIKNIAKSSEIYKFIEKYYINYTNIPRNVIDAISIYKYNGNDPNRVGEYLDKNNIIPVLFSTTFNRCYALSALYCLFSSNRLFLQTMPLLKLYYDGYEKLRTDAIISESNSMGHIFREFLYMYRAYMLNKQSNSETKPINIQHLMNLFVYYYNISESGQEDSKELIRLLLDEIGIYFYKLYEIFAYEVIEVTRCANTQQKIETFTETSVAFVHPSVIDNSSDNSSDNYSVKYSVKYGLSNTTIKEPCTICRRDATDKHSTSTLKYNRARNNKIMILELITTINTYEKINGKLDVKSDNYEYNVKYKEIFNGVDYVLKAGLIYGGFFSGRSSAGHYNVIVFNESKAYELNTNVTTDRRLVKSNIIKTYENVNDACNELSRSPLLVYEVE